jgi:hypothetical protein
MVNCVHHLGIRVGGLGKESAMLVLNRIYKTLIRALAQASRLPVMA